MRYAVCLCHRLIASCSACRLFIAIHQLVRVPMDASMRARRAQRASDGTAEGDTNEIRCHPCSRVCMAARHPRRSSTVHMTQAQTLMDWCVYIVEQSEDCGRAATDSAKVSARCAALVQLIPAGVRTVYAAECARRRGLLLRPYPAAEAPLTLRVPLLLLQEDSELLQQRQ